MHYVERAGFCKNPISKKLFQLIENKKSNLAFSADVVHCEQLLDLVDKIGSEICVLKTHVDIMEDYTADFPIELKKLARKYDFLIFEDRKFSDIGNTVRLQYQRGIYRIADWADMINAHALPGPNIITSLAEVKPKDQHGLLLLAEMSPEKNLFNSGYTKKTVAMAEQFSDFVIGFIAQKKISAHPGWIYLTPGIQFSEKKDGRGQQYITPEQAIFNNQTDVIIVGRGILQADDPIKEAEKYRKAAWNAYIMREASVKK